MKELININVENPSPIELRQIDAAIAEHFIAYYESNGWKVGKVPMVSWKATVVTWKKRQNKPAQGGGARRDPSRPIQTQGIGRTAEEFEAGFEDLGEGL